MQRVYAVGDRRSYFATTYLLRKELRGNIQRPKRLVARTRRWVARTTYSLTQYIGRVYNIHGRGKRRWLQGNLKPIRRVLYGKFHEYERRFESRLDFWLYNLRFTRRLSQAGSLIFAGHVRINGLVERQYRFLLKPLDVVSFSPKVARWLQWKYRTRALRKNRSTRATRKESTHLQRVSRSFKNRASVSGLKRGSNASWSLKNTFNRLHRASSSNLFRRSPFSKVYAVGRQERYKARRSARRMLARARSNARKVARRARYALQKSARLSNEVKRSLNRKDSLRGKAQQIIKAIAHKKANLNVIKRLYSSNRRSSKTIKKVFSRKLESIHCTYLPTKRVAILVPVKVQNLSVYTRNAAVLSRAGLRAAYLLCAYSNRSIKQLSKVGSIYTFNKTRTGVIDARLRETWSRVCYAAQRARTAHSLAARTELPRGLSLSGNYSHTNALLRVGSQSVRRWFSLAGVKYGSTSPRCYSREVLSQSQHFQHFSLVTSKGFYASNRGHVKPAKYKVAVRSRSVRHASRRMYRPAPVKQSEILERGRSWLIRQQQRVQMLNVRRVSARSVKRSWRVAATRIARTLQLTTKRKQRLTRRTAARTSRFEARRRQRTWLATSFFFKRRRRLVTQKHWFVRKAFVFTEAHQPTSAHVFTWRRSNYTRNGVVRAATAISTERIYTLIRRHRHIH